MLYLKFIYLFKDNFYNGIFFFISEKDLWDAYTLLIFTRRICFAYNLLGIRFIVEVLILFLESASSLWGTFVLLSFPFWVLDGFSEYGYL